MQVSFKSRVILDSSINTFNQTVRNFVESQAKPALENTFDDDLVFYISRDKHQGIIVNGRQLPRTYSPELNIKVKKNKHKGILFNHYTKSTTETTRFGMINTKLLKTLEQAVRALADPNRYKYTVEEVLNTARKAVNKIKI